MHRGAIAPYWTIRGPGFSEARARARATRRAKAWRRAWVPLTHALSPALWQPGARLAGLTCTPRARPLPCAVPIRRAARRTLKIFDQNGHISCAKKCIEGP